MTQLTLEYLVTKVVSDTLLGMMKYICIQMLEHHYF